MVAVSETRIDPLDMLDSLSMLVERSLIGFDEVTGRYSMLETVRQYSREKLADSDEGQRVRDKHAEHVRGFLKSLPAPEKIDDSTKMIALVNGDIDNVRAAFEHLIASEQIGEAGWVLGQIHMYWIWTGKLEEVRAYYRRLLESFRENESAIDEGVADALMAYCSLYTFLVHHEEALSDIAFGMRVWTKIGDAERLGGLLRIRGNIELARGRVDDAERSYLESLAATNGEDPESRIANNLGLVEVVRKNWDKARPLLEESLAKGKSLRMRLPAYANLSRVAFNQGHLDETRDFILKLFEWHGETLSPFGIMPTLERVAEYALAMGRPDDSATCLGAGQSLRDEYRFARSNYEQEDFDRIRAGCLSSLGESEFDRCYAVGAAMSLVEAQRFGRRAMDS